MRKLKVIEVRLVVEEGEVEAVFEEISSSPPVQDALMTLAVQVRNPNKLEKKFIENGLKQQEEN